MGNNRLFLLSLLEVLLEKGVLTHEDAKRVKDVQDLVGILVSSGIMKNDEVESLRLLYEGFLTETLSLLKGPVDPAHFAEIKRRFGQKFPRIITFLERIQDGKNPGRSGDRPPAEEKRP